MQKGVQLTVVGKVFRSNKRKVLALNASANISGCSDGIFFNSTSKTLLHENGCEKAKEFNLNAALIQTTRDKAIEILKLTGTK